MFCATGYERRRLAPPVAGPTRECECVIRVVAFHLASQVVVRTGHDPQCTAAPHLVA
jgi:hypothetical protein